MIWTPIYAGVTSKSRLKIDGTAVEGILKQLLNFIQLRNAARHQRIGVDDDMLTQRFQVRFQLSGGDARFLQRCGQIELPHQAAGGVGQLLRRVCFIADGQANHRGQVGVAADAAIGHKLDGVGQKDGGDTAVGNRFEQCARAVPQGVSQGHLAVAQGNPGNRGGIGHLFPRFFIVGAIGHSAGQVGEHHTSRLQAEAVGKVVGPAAAVRFDGVAQHVDARVGGDEGGQIFGEQRVHDGDVWCGFPRAEGELTFFGRVGEHNAVVGLGAGARRGGDADEPRFGPQPQIFHRADRFWLDARPLVQNPHRFGRIHAGATAQPDDPVWLVAQHGLCPALHGLQGGVWLDLGKDLAVDIGVRQGLLYQVRKAQFGNVGVGDDEGALAVQHFQLAEGIFAKEKFRTFEEPHGLRPYPY